MPQKLRASCDPCHFAKIKCIKTNGGCQRCESTGEHCKNSPALPRVYQKRRSRRSTTDHSPADMPLSDQASASDGFTEKALHQQSLGSANLLPLTTKPPVSTAFDSQSFSMSAGESNEFCWPFVPDSSMIGDPLHESNLGTLDLWQPGNTPLGMIAPATPMSLTTTSQGSLAFPASTTATGSHESQHSRSETPSANSTSDDVLPEALKCSCLPGLLSAMQDIAPYLNTSTSALDTVLCTNRIAAKSCITSLKCKYGICSRTDVSCVAIACGLLDRMLVSYQSALDTFCASIEGGDNEDDQRDMEDHEDHRSTVTTTYPIQVKLGKFTVGKTQQVSWAKNIVAGEIANMQDGVKGCTVAGSKIRGNLLEHVSKRCTVILSEVGSQKDI